ncbi:mitochondrial potassium channel ATP-binding subunit [Protopterus annectens]|uniref:mitochondrial potassium channel ATP-binding subunit n=1 Tax=Protopterus annectens TaxID=7888 RepID=UPI001CFA46B9|nr:mitochondrial potassium channel ATP-binding subunit [Protopterus annectens]
MFQNWTALGLRWRSSVSRVALATGRSFTDPVRHFSTTTTGKIRKSSSVLRFWERVREVRWQGIGRIQWCSRKNGLMLFFVGPTLVTVGVRLYNNIAYCQLDVNNNHLQWPSKKSEEKEPQFNWPEFWKFLRPQLLLLLAAVVFAFGAALLNIQIPIMLGELVNVVARYTREHSGQYLKDMKEPALKLLSFYGIQGLLTCGYIVLLSRAGERIAADMRKSLFTSLLRQDVAFFDAHKTGQLVNRLTADIQEFKSSFKLVVSQGLRSITQTVGCFVSLYIISPKLTVLMVVVMPVLVGTGALIGSFLRRLSRRAQEQIAKATGVADEALGNVRTVRAFAMEDREAELYSEEVDKSSHISESLGAGIALFQGLSNFALNCIVLGTIFAGGSLMAGDELSAGDLMSFLVASQTVQRSMAMISVLFGQVVRGLTAGARVFEFMLLEPQIPLTGGIKIPYYSLIGEVHFQDITFSYPTRPGHVVLKNFNLSLPPSKTVAIVGQSGSGKSTVAALLERFYDPSTGAVFLDGHDIRTLNPSWLRGHVIGFISQEPVLFGTSIMENIRFGKPSATDEEVFTAAKQSNAHDFIQSFPEGYRTVVGERGVTLSGGQKQRIAIARALIKNPSILILDEATSALDAESERVVQEALDRAASGRTVLVIAHRLSTVQGADLICVIANGQVKEAGTHVELLKKRGLYAELIQRQTAEHQN